MSPSFLNELEKKASRSSVSSGNETNESFESMLQGNQKTDAKQSNEQEGTTTAEASSGNFIQQLFDNIKALLQTSQKIEEMQRMEDYVKEIQKHFEDQSGTNDKEVKEMLKEMEDVASSLKSSISSGTPETNSSGTEEKEDVEESPSEKLEKLYEMIKALSEEYQKVTEDRQKKEALLKERQEQEALLEANKDHVSITPKEIELRNDMKTAAS